MRGDIDEAGDELRAREVSRGFADDEEQMLASSEIETKDVQGLRKPRYLNRIKTGYEWNKYNQAHYTPEEPPPRRSRATSSTFLPRPGRSEQASNL